MFKAVINNLNEKLKSTGFFNSINSLAEKIEREGLEYPAIISKNEYKRIDLDPQGSLCYWRKNGSVSFSQEENSASSCAVQYRTTIPLRFIGFTKNTKCEDFFADNVAAEVLSILTTNNSSLKGLLKAKLVNLIAVKYDTDKRSVASEEYTKVDFDPRYTHAYFSIDFNLIIVRNNGCYVPVCGGSFSEGFSDAFPNGTAGDCDGSFSNGFSNDFNN